MSTQPNEPPPFEPTPATGLTPDERLWATLAHLAAFIGLLTTAGALAVLGPLVVWLLKKDESSYVAHHAREALNFQITMLIAAAVLFVAGYFTCGISWALFVPVGVANVVLSIVGAVKANEGQRWTYPFSLRLVD